MCKFRPDNLLTNFITWRGMLTKMLCSPYNKTEPWKVAATLYNGTIYLSEVETEEARKKTETQTPRMQEMCYWGVKFEDYVTCTGNSMSCVDMKLLFCYCFVVVVAILFLEPPIVTGRPGTPFTPSPQTGTVNSNRAFCTIVRTRMNMHSIVMAAEVDCCDHVSRDMHVY